MHRDLAPFIRTYLIILVPSEALRGENKPVFSRAAFDEGDMETQPAFPDDLVTQGLGGPLGVFTLGGSATGGGQYIEYYSISGGGYYIEYQNYLQVQYRNVKVLTVTLSNVPVKADEVRMVGVHVGQLNLYHQLQL